jgi:hypothetical protein
LSLATKAAKSFSLSVGCAGKEGRRGWRRERMGEKRSLQKERGKKVKG